MEQIHYRLPRRASQNIYHLLSDRENGIDRRYYVHKRSPANFNYNFFKCIPPNLTISNIEKPTNFIRKFSPDGNYLICFSRDQQSFENYKFLGTRNAARLLYNWKSEYIPPEINRGYAKEIRQNIFNRLFQLKWSIQLTSFMRPLYREFSIFTEDSQFAILASYMPVQEENLPSYYTLNTLNNLQFDHDLNWYRFFMIRLSDGAIMDTLEYSYDFINLSHNHGVCIYGNMIAITSLYHQSIDIIQLDEGKFVKLLTIGRFFHGTDECLCNDVPEYRNDCQIFDMKLRGLNNKVLIRLYKDIFKVDDQPQQGLKNFYRLFKIYETMDIQKVQFIDNDHLLIRFNYNKSPTSSTTDPYKEGKLYSIYSISNDEIVINYPGFSSELLRTLISFVDIFRDTRCLFTGRSPSSTSNNIYSQCIQKKLIESFPNGETEAAHRLLGQLPLSAQSFTATPYLDFSLFNYDYRLVSALERPRFSNCDAIRFCDRETGLTKFRIYPGIREENVDSNRLVSKELVAYIFHPFEPFLISVQKISNRYITNFHIRNEGTFVKLF